ncbi:MAG: hypothetical protein WC297_02065 [Candidatus Paceibacterota bacterium]|jgi:membrane protein YdbS with pleckstrin-like domain
MGWKLVILIVTLVVLLTVFLRTGLKLFFEKENDNGVLFIAAATLIAIAINCLFAVGLAHLAHWLWQWQPIR